MRAVPNPEGLRDDGEDDARDHNGESKVVEVPGQIDLTIPNEVPATD